MRQRSAATLGKRIGPPKLAWGSKPRKGGSSSKKMQMNMEEETLKLQIMFQKGNRYKVRQNEMSKFYQNNERPDEFDIV